MVHPVINDNLIYYLAEGFGYNAREFMLSENVLGIGRIHG
jgi:hypothetical protein